MREKQVLHFNTFSFPFHHPILRVKKNPKPMNSEKTTNQKDLIHPNLLQSIVSPMRALSYPCRSSLLPKNLGESHFTFSWSTWLGLMNISGKCSSRHQSFELPCSILRLTFKLTWTDITRGVCHHNWGKGCWLSTGLWNRQRVFM